MFLVFLLRCFGDLRLPYTHENESLFGKSTAFLKKNGTPPHPEGKRREKLPPTPFRTTVHPF